MVRRILNGRAAISEKLVSTIVVFPLGTPYSVLAPSAARQENSACSTPYRRWCRYSDGEGATRFCLAMFAYALGFGLVAVSDKGVVSVLLLDCLLQRKTLSARRTLALDRQHGARALFRRLVVEPLITADSQP